MTTATATHQNGSAAKSASTKSGTKPANGKAANAKAANTANGRKPTQRSNSARTANQRNGSARRLSRDTMPSVPGWLAAVVSVVGVGVAVGAGLYATRKQWMPTAKDWKNDFSAAFADDETDHDNFDQTRNAGVDAMRDHPGDDWDDVDDSSDASFPASDPPSFNPGTA